MRTPRLKVLLSLVLVMGCSCGELSGAASIYTNKVCGFQVAGDMGDGIAPARPRDKSEPCSFKVSRGDPDHFLSLTIYSGALNEAADKAGFTRDGDRWWINGEGSQLAHEIRGKTWTGLIGSVNFRQYDENGFAGIGIETIALLSDGQNRVAKVVDLHDEELGVKVFVNSFEFLPRQK